MVARDGAEPFLAVDVPKVRLATACEQAGLPMERITAAIGAGRLSFAFLEGATFQRWVVRSGRAYRQVSQETGLPVDLLAAVLESMGFAPMAPDTTIREDELEIVALLQRGIATGLLDPARPPARRGLAAGPVVIQGGDYFGRTCQPRCPDRRPRPSRPGPGQPQRAESAPPPKGVRFRELGGRRLEGFASPVRLLEGRQA